MRSHQHHRSLVRIWPPVPGNAPGRTGEAQQKGGEDPVHERALAAVQERAREVIEGALAGVLFTAYWLQVFHSADAARRGLERGLPHQT